ncbi:MAG: RpiB/LacA/LacB family sugar-phosphate isomerase, partial [Eubacteriales bacterium]|nr:RpiB/LacA/LacB family sugar-phosphate isomerase [Eubacteriales bacterium]
MKIALGSDHAGYDLKMYIRAHLEAQGHEVNDLGVHNNE